MKPYIFPLLCIVSFALHGLIILVSQDLVMVRYSRMLPEDEPPEQLKVSLLREPKNIFLDTNDKTKPTKHTRETPFIGNKSTSPSDPSKKTSLPDNVPFSAKGIEHPSVAQQGELLGLSDTILPHAATQPQWQESRPPRPKQPTERQTTDTNTTAMHLPQVPTQEPAPKRDATPQQETTPKRPTIVTVEKRALKETARQLAAPNKTPRFSPAQKNTASHSLRHDMQQYLIMENKYGDYYKKVKRTIQFHFTAWNMRNRDVSIGILEDQTILIRCTILPDGTGQEVTVYTNQHNEQFAANVCVEVLRVSMPFPPFPAEVEEPTLPLMFNFNF